MGSAKRPNERRGREPDRVKLYRPKSADEIRKNMSAIRSAENRAESALRRSLHARGLRYQKYRRDLPGNPDIVFPTEKVAVFVDGDYWHCRILVEDGLDALKATLRTAQRDYWLEKFQRRVARDKHVTDVLKADGWRVLRFWESEVKRDIESAALAVTHAVRRRGGAKSKRI
jgi:DNA mismatch endonuclease (patch repair protein)